jgi:arylsulfatase
MRYSFDNPKAESTRQTQYYAMLGTRGIYHKGWKAVARHGALSGKSKFMEDKWELYHIETDRSETQDVGDQFPEKKMELIATWFAVAGANHVFPLDDRTAIEQLTVERPEPAKARENYTYYPGTSEIPEGVAPNIRNRSFGVLANCTITDPQSAQGILMAQGGVAGGHTLFLKGGKLYYVYNFLGMEEQKAVSSDIVPKGDVVLGVKFNKEKEEPRGCANGTVTLYVNDKAVGSGKFRTQPGKFALAGEGLVIGRMGADSVTKECKAPYGFKGAAVKSVTINVTGAHYRDLEIEALAMLSRE